MKNKAFTLLELLVVLFILSLLLGLAVFRTDHFIRREERELDEIVSFLTHMRNVALVKKDRVSVRISNDSITASKDVFSFKYVKAVNKNEIIFTPSGATGQSDTYIFSSKRTGQNYELKIPVGFQKIRWTK